MNDQNHSRDSFFCLLLQYSAQGGTGSDSFRLLALRFRCRSNSRGAEWRIRRHSWACNGVQWRNFWGSRAGWAAAAPEATQQHEHHPCPHQQLQIPFSFRTDQLNALLYTSGTELSIIKPLKCQDCVRAYLKLSLGRSLHKATHSALLSDSNRRQHEVSKYPAYLNYHWKQ